jgi:biotin carboxyl carrier protein
VQYEVEVNGRVRQVTVIRRDGRVVVAMDDREWIVDAAHIGQDTVSLLMEQGGSTVVRSREVTLSADPSGLVTMAVEAIPLVIGLNHRRRGRKDAGGEVASGPQRISAPMPGKIVRVLVQPGDTVQPRQPVVVIEAMKMENELRASREGIVTEIAVKEGQSVEAGALLAIITPA